MSGTLLTGYRVLGFDLETTGFDHRKDRIVQYALVGSDTDGRHINLQSLVNPRVKIPPETTRVHGITNDDVRGMGEFSEHVNEISSLVDGSIIVGHNVLQFDWRFLEVECTRAGVEAPIPKGMIDTLVLARRLRIPGRHALGHLCARFGIEMSRSHQADADAGATLLLLWRMMQAYPDGFTGSIDDLLDSFSD
uniref:Exonuclease RNase T and DNA polymerase III (DPO3E, dnaQ) n=1 Tax=uncultured marine group II/III euryarchaeote KM3_200_E08 TaxID=1457977 RepID=A0A075GU20_9EURY|nr:Exonuclease RNase T and DNA polymerase III (DPO3E, dnaQ) [uncultured marine group II/III euryarchaeote KM3_200_E08]